MFGTIHHWLANTTGPETWIERDGWVGPILDPYITVLGEGLLAGILGGALLVGFYIHSNNIAFPAIILLLLGGTLSAVLPAPMLNLARTLIVIGLAASLLAVARRYVLT
jgi:hypothetical protein